MSWEPVIQLIRVFYVSINGSLEVFEYLKVYELGVEMDVSEIFEHL